MNRVLMVLVVGLLASCSPNKGYRDRLKIKGTHPGEKELVVDVLETYEVKAVPLGNQVNPKDIPRLIPNGETWLPRTLSFRDIKVEWSSDRTRAFVRGSAQWNNPSTNSHGDIRFVLAGNWHAERGMGNLVAVSDVTESTNEQATVRGRLYCIETNEEGHCSSTIAELFVRVDGLIFSGQIENTQSESLANRSFDDEADSQEPGYNDELEGFDRDLEAVGSNEEEVDQLYRQKDIETEQDEIIEVDVLPAPPISSWDPGLPPPQLEDSELETAANLLEQGDAEVSLPTPPAQAVINEESLNEMPTSPQLLEPQVTETKPSMPSQVPAAPTPVAPAPVAPAPVKPAPVAPAPVKPAPVAPAPVKPAPVAPAPVKPAPVAPAPAKPAPVAPAPAKSAPVAPAPAKPAPVAPAPVKPAPVAPAPVKPAPVAPAPVKPAPVAPAPVKPAPVVPAPVKPAPVAPAPVKPAPVALTPAATLPTPPVQETQVSLQEVVGEAPPKEASKKTPETTPEKTVEPPAKKASSVVPPPVKTEVPEKSLPEQKLEEVKGESQRTNATSEASSEQPSEKEMGQELQEQSVGTHSRGSLRKGTSLKAVVDKMAERSRIRVIRPEQKRYFGNYATVEFLVKGSVLLNRILPGMFLEVGDLSDADGGKLRPHKSHQNGLDIDVGFFFEGVKKGYYGRTALSSKGLDPRFDRALHWKFFKSLMTYYHDKVYFILLHPSVKRAMCEEAVRSGDIVRGKEIDPIVMHTLRRLVPEKSHYNHFHVRLKCPAKDRRCVQTVNDIPMSMGCFKK